MSKAHSRAWQDSASVVVARIVTITCSLAMMAIAARQFSLDEFGLWALVTPMVTIVLSLDLGIGNAVRNRLALEELSGASDDFASSFYFLCAVVIFYALLVTAVWASGGFRLIFKTDDFNLRTLGSDAVWLSSLIVLLRLPLYLGLNSFFSFREARLNAFFDGSIWLAALIATALAAAAGFGILKAVVLYQIAGVAVSVAAFLIFVKRRGWRPRWPSDGRQRVLRLLRLSIPFALLQIFTVIMNYASTFVVGAVVSVDQMGPYRATVSVCSALTALHLAYLMPLWSEFSLSIVGGKRRLIKNQLWRALGQTMVIALPLTSFVIIGPYIMRIWLGIAFDNRLLLGIVASTALLQALGNTLSVMLNGVGRPALTLYSVVPGSLLCLPLAFTLGHEYGTTGVASAFLVSSFLVLLAIGTITFFWLRAHLSDTTPTIIVTGSAPQ